jgi:hypothetical protein
MKQVRAIRSFFGAVVVLSICMTTTITMFDSGRVGTDPPDVEQELRLVSLNNGNGEVPVTVVRLPSSAVLPSFDHNKRMSQQRQPFPETAVLPPKHCSFTLEQIGNASNHTGMDTAFARTITNTKPIWVPGYPGSGSELFRDLVQTMTGDLSAAADIYKDVAHRCRNAVTCKTHWPAYPHHAPDQYQYPNEKHHLFAPNVILLLRNPATALASHFNFKWETANGVKDHTAQAPQADWTVWRNARFARQIQNWKNMILQWHQHAYYHVSLYVPFERLVSPRGGPICAAKLADELRRAGATTSVVAAADIPCLWRTVVLDQPRKQRHQSGQHDRYEPSYTVEQQHIMVDMLHDIMFQLPDRVALNEILTDYLYEIQTNLNIDEGL